MMIYIQWFRPLESNYANWLETFNEMCILILSNIAICYTDFVPDPEVRYDFGLVYVISSLVMTAVHNFLFLRITVKGCKLYGKK